jgi:hypothetical protein
VTLRTLDQDCLKRASASSSWCNEGCCPALRVLMTHRHPVVKRVPPANQHLARPHDRSGYFGKRREVDQATVPAVRELRRIGSNGSTELCLEFAGEGAFKGRKRIEGDRYAIKAVECSFDGAGKLGAALECRQAGGWHAEQQSKRTPCDLHRRSICQSSTRKRQNGTQAMRMHSETSVSYT